MTEFKLIFVIINFIFMDETVNETAHTKARMTARMFLDKWYIERRINPGDTEDSEIKKKLLGKYVVIPNYPVGKQPALFELEREFLHDNDYMI